MKRSLTLALLSILLIAPSLSCNTLFMSQLHTQTAVMATATATMWTPTPTNTPTPTPTPTIDPWQHETFGRASFSYLPPVEWERTKYAGSTFDAWTLDGITNCALAINAVQSGKGAEQAAEEMITAFTTQYGESFNIISQEKFYPTAGEDAYKVVFQMGEGTINAKFSVIYVFQKKGLDVLVVYVRNLDSYQDQDAIVEESMMSFRFDT